MFPALGFPDWTLSFITVLLLLGLPIACLFAWAFELTPEGITRVGAVEEGKSIAQSTGRKIDFIIIGALVLIIGGMFYTGTFFVPDTANEQPTIAALDKSVAVLPFADMSEGGDQEWFSDGLTDEILNSLTMLPELKVTARTSAFHFKGQNIAISDIAEQLGVVHVVEGSVRRQGDTLRITAQLIRAEDDFHLWSQTYDRPAGDIFEVQRDVTENIARSLDVVLDDERREAMFSTGTKNIEAYEAYKKGTNLLFDVHYGNAPEGKTLWDANILFDRALEADPNYAAATYWRWDAYIHYLLGDTEWSPAQEGLTKENAFIAINNIFDQAIKAAKTTERKTYYQLLKIFNSDDWSEIPPLLEKIRQNPAGYVFDDVYAIEVLSALGETEASEIAIELNQKRNPFDQFAWMYTLGSKIGQKNCPELLELTEKANRIFGEGRLNLYSVLCQYLTNDQQGLENWNINGAELDNILSAKALILAINGENEKLGEYILPPTEYGIYAGWMMQVYKILGKQDIVNEAALEIDDEINGPNFWGPARISIGGILPFQMQFAPNYVRKLRQAGLSEEKIQSMFMPSTP